MYLGLTGPTDPFADAAEKSTLKKSALDQFEMLMRCTIFQQDTVSVSAGVVTLEMFQTWYHPHLLELSPNKGGNLLDPDSLRMAQWASSCSRVFCSSSAHRSLWAVWLRDLHRISFADSNVVDKKAQFEKYVLFGGRNDFERASRPENALCTATFIQ